MFKIIKKDIWWMIQNSTGEFVYIVRKTGWAGLKADLPEYAKNNKRLAVYEARFGPYNKCDAVKLCEKLNKEEEKL